MKFDVFSVAYNIFPDAEHSLVTGRVVDESGNPVPCVAVKAVVEEDGVAVFAQNVATSASGTYAIMAPPRECAVKVWAECLGLSSVTNTVAVRRCESVEVTDYYEFGCVGKNVCGNSWGNEIVLSGSADRFDDGEAVEIAGGESVSLTGGQAGWLNGLGAPRAAVADALRALSPDDLEKAYLLNLDIAKPECGGGIEVIGMDAAGGSVSVTVRLSRAGAVEAAPGVAAPINGVLRLYGAESPGGPYSECAAGAAADGWFGEDGLATCVFGKDGSKSFFRPRVVNGKGR